ncbi:MAG TPA: hypothetical protein DIT61_13710, partial [Pseudomonas sp.]|nr:hypothetical protein [Pseudomonas sp.]
MLSSRQRGASARALTLALIEFLLSKVGLADCRVQVVEIDLDFIDKGVQLIRFCSQQRYVRLAQVLPAG